MKNALGCLELGSEMLDEGPVVPMTPGQLRARLGG
jgi:hypothetical protein